LVSALVRRRDLLRAANSGPSPGEGDRDGLVVRDRADGRLFGASVGLARADSDL